MGRKIALLLVLLLLAVPFSAAKTFYIQDDGTVVDPDAPAADRGSQSTIVIGADEWETLQALRQRSTERQQYDGGEAFDYAAAQQAQDDWVDEYLDDRYQRGRSITAQYSYGSDWRHPIQSWQNWRNDRSYGSPYYGYDQSPYDSGQYWVATDYYYRNRFVGPYGYRFDDRYGNRGYDWRQYDRYGYNDCDYNTWYYRGYCDGYHNYYGNDTYRPFDWYAYVNGQYVECNGDDFKRYDCSYRWDGAHYRYALGPDDWFSYDKLYHLDDVDVSDRFTLVNGRYTICPLRGFDHDECVYYYKGGSFYYDDPSDNSFWGANVEWDTDLDNPQSAAAFNAMAAQEQTGNPQSTPTPNSPAAYAAYYNQYSQFNFADGQFVPCTGSCRYYQAADGRMYGIAQQ